jgi:alanine dehydrogenase
MPTLMLTRADVAKLLDLPACIVAVEEAFRQQTLGTAVPPHVLGVHVPDGAFHIKAAGVRSPTPYFAAKVNGNFAGNRERFGLPTIQGVIVLADLTNGRPLAVMDSIEITTQRTGAATAVAAKYLTPDRPAVVTVIGCGQQGRIQLRSVSMVREIREVFVYDTDASTAQAFVEDTASTMRAPVRVSPDRRTALAHSDIVITCTTSRRPVVFSGDLTAGTFVAAVGADNPQKQEIDPVLLAAATVVTDVTDQAATIGDLHHAIAAGLMRAEDVYAELGEIVTGRKAAPSDATGIVIFDSTGMALQDVTTAALVYERAIERGVGLWVPLTDACPAS